MGLYTGKTLIVFGAAALGAGAGAGLVCVGSAMLTPRVEREAHLGGLRSASPKLGQSQHAPGFVVESVSEIAKIKPELRAATNRKLLDSRVCQTTGVHQMVAVSTIKTKDSIRRPVWILRDNNLYLIRPRWVENRHASVDTFAGGIIARYNWSIGSVLDGEGSG